MNLKAMRNAHLYLGVFFSPLLILFIVTGCWQTFEFHMDSKDPQGYKAPQVLKSFSEIHLSQRWSDKHKKPEPSVPFSYLIVLMSLGLLVSTVLGIIMAFKYTHAWAVWVCLFMGIFVPFVLLWIAWGSK